MKSQRIGMLGAGNMAGALIRGLLASGLVEPDRIRASDVRRERLAELEAAHGIRTHADNRELVAWAEIVVLAVKPQSLDGVLADLDGAFQRETLLISVAAGVPTTTLEARLPESVRVVRAMPNAAALALCGATAIAPGARASAEDLGLARALFDAVGRTVELDEALLDAVTGLSGSGPAYVLLLIEALADGGVQVGLPRDAALLLAAQTVLGSAKLLLETGEHPGRLRDMVTSPGGTTIAGLARLEAGGVRAALIDAVDAATRRSRELGQLAAQPKPTK